MKYPSRTTFGTLLASLALWGCGGGGDDAGTIGPVTPPASTSAFQCFNPALLNNPGTILRVVYNLSGIASGTQTLELRVGNLTTFEGSAARESTLTTTGTVVVNGTTVPTNTSLKSYDTAAADGTITTYGDIDVDTESAPGGTTTTTRRTVYSPPRVERNFTMMVGQSLVQTEVGRVSTTVTPPSGIPGTPVTSNTSVSTTTRFVGIESVTVPAGTYTACRFEDVESTTPSEVTTSWIAVGVGYPVRISTNTPQGTLTGSAQTVSITN